MKQKNFSKLALSVLTVTSLSLFGCGGGSSEDGNKIKITTDADWVGYQVGDGQWQTLQGSPSTTEESNPIKNYEFTADGKYGVAIYCAGDKEGTIYQFTKDELRDIVYYCNEHFSRYSVAGTYQNVSEGGIPVSAIDSVNTFSNLNFSSNEFTIQNVPEGTWDLVSVIMTVGDGDMMSPQKVVITREINVNGDKTGLNVDFNQGSDLTQYSYSVTGGEGGVMLLTKNNTILNSSISSDGGSYWYKINNGLNQDDYYLFYGGSSDERKMRVESISATDSNLGDKNMNLNSINDLTSGSFDSNTGTISGLNYQPSQSSPALLGYNILIENDVEWDISISKGWLGTETSYTLPDLSSVEGFPTGGWFGDLSTVDVNLSALMSNATIQELANQDPKMDSNIFLLKGKVFEIASQELQ